MDMVDMPPSESFSQLKARLAEEKQTKEQVLQETGGIDLDNIPGQQHIWVKRGIKVSCEGARHPHHSHFLV